MTAERRKLACICYVADDWRKLESTAGKALYSTFAIKLPGTTGLAYLVLFPLVLKSPDHIFPQTRRDALLRTDHVRSRSSGAF
mgnify:FL=1|jgi:hypothetical protein